MTSSKRSSGGVKRLLVALLCAGATGALAQQGKSWEYAWYSEAVDGISWAEAGREPVTARDWKAFASASTKAFGHAADSRFAVFEAVGAEGWELVYCGENRIDPRSDRVAFLCAFKRSK